MEDVFDRASKPNKSETRVKKNQIIAKEFEQQHKTSRKSLPCVASEIKLMNLYLPASNSDNADLDASEYFSMFCVQRKIFSFEYLPPPLPPARTNIL